jgi:hypothetical protein
LGISPPFKISSQRRKHRDERHASDAFARQHGVFVVLSTSLSAEYDVVARWREISEAVEALFDDHAISVYVCK